MPSIVEIEIPVAQLTGAPNKSFIIPLNNAQRATLMVQASVPATAGQWVLKAVPTSDNTIPGQIIATANFPATPARVNGGTAEIAHKWAYVEQVTAIVGATLEKVVVYLQ